MSTFVTTNLIFESSAEFSRLENFGEVPRVNFMPEHSRLNKMNIFEDLVDELKEANLIEETIIETGAAENPKTPEAKTAALEKPLQAAKNAVSDKNPLPSAKVTEIKSATEVDVSKNKPHAPNPAPKTIEPVKAAVPVEKKTAETVDDSFEVETEEIVSEAEFYRRRATGEVAFLQTVESAFAGVEREQLKIIPKPFDDLKVKKVLHLFMQASDDVKSPEFGKAEAELLRETQNWYASLSARDARFMTAHLRRFCETTRPQLSSSALAALARFYRNAPFSETIRSKYDLVVTRLFSKETDENRRETVFTHDELIKHIQELYAEWSSVSLYPTEENDPELLQILQKFGDFTTEANDSQNFDALIDANFFNRVRLFKENTNESFFAPTIVAAAIESNVRVGNRYIELLDREKIIGNVANLENKYGLSHDQAISEATGKTLSLLELLRQRKAVLKTVEPKPVPVAEQKEAESKIAARHTSPAPAKSKKWMVSVVILVAIALTAFYLGTKSNVGKTTESAGVPKINLENSMMKDFLSEAVVEEGTLKGVVLPSWNHFTAEKKKDVLKQIVSFGAEKGFGKVQLDNKDGKMVGSAADGMVFVND